MNRTNNPKLTAYSQQLRTAMTKQERKLWYEFLKPSPLPWNRQKVIGNYIVDFYCAQAKLVVELDGAQHYDDEARKYDKKRDEYLAACGFTVLRYTDIEFERNFKGICEDIWFHMGL